MRRCKLSFSTNCDGVLCVADRFEQASAELPRLPSWLSAGGLCRIEEEGLGVFVFE